MESVSIIANGFLLACDAANRGGRFHLLLRDGRIAEIAPSLESLTAQHPRAPLLDATGMLITPGFVNAHFHGDSLLHRERTAGRHYATWGADRAFTAAAERLTDVTAAEDLVAVYTAASLAHLLSGTTTVGEYGPPVEAGPFVAMLQAVDRTGLRAAVTLQNWEQIRTAGDLATGRPSCFINLGDPSSFTVYTFETLVRTSREKKLPLLAHMGELREEGEHIRKYYRKDLMAVLRDFGVLTPGALVVHANHCTDAEVQLAAEQGIPVVVCPRSAALKQTGYPALRPLLAQGVFLCLGSDWGATDMFEEMRFLARLPLLVPGMPDLRPTDIVRMATINGAHALGVAADTGSVERGKSADLVLFDLTDVRLPFVSDHPGGEELAALLVHHMDARNIARVLAKGRTVAQRGETPECSARDAAVALRRAVERSYPRSKPPAPGDVPGRAKPKIIPFAGEPVGAPADRGGFEDGAADALVEPAGEETPAASPTPPAASPAKPPAASPPPAPPLQPRAPAPRGTQLPELSKDVRRVFGEDDDVQE
jgi:5-methylthioadenosine/S-adenosylhomocysteine deaminase